MKLGAKYLYYVESHLTLHNQEVPTPWLPLKLAHFSRCPEARWHARLSLWSPMNIFSWHAVRYYAAACAHVCGPPCCRLVTGWRVTRTLRQPATCSGHDEATFIIAIRVLAQSVLSVRLGLTAECEFWAEYMVITLSCGGKKSRKMLKNGENAHSYVLAMLILPKKML